MVKTALQLQIDLKDYASPKSKLTQMVKRGEIFRLSRGGYVTSLQDPKYPVAGVLRSPSYISFQTALAYHQMIPERVHAIMSAGYRLNKDYTYDTPLGRYSFHYIPDAVFSWGIEPALEDGAGFRIASAEKALCDTLYLHQEQAMNRHIVCSLNRMPLCYTIFPLCLPVSSMPCYAGNGLPV